MFDPKSRYYLVDTAEMALPDGRRIAYKRRRLLPQSRTMPVLVEVEVRDDDRLDLITARTLGDPEQFWRICDANLAELPEELVEETGRRLVIPLPVG